MMWSSGSESNYGVLEVKVMMCSSGSESYVEFWK
jgi:hypothetical protein